MTFTTAQANSNSKPKFKSRAEPTPANDTANDLHTAPLLPMAMLKAPDARELREFMQAFNAIQNPGSRELVLRAVRRAAEQG